jgi:hypothetical protein
VGTPAATNASRSSSRLDRRVEPDVEALPEARERGPGVQQLAEELRQALRVARAGRRFRVVFGELQRIGQDEGVGSRRGAGHAVAGIDLRQADLVVTQAEVFQHLRVARRHPCDALAEPPERLRRVLHPALVGGIEEEGPQERAEQPSAEGEPAIAHALRQRGAEAVAGPLAQQRVPFDDRIAAAHPMGPAGSPDRPVIPAHRGHDCVTRPFSARSITRLDIRSMTRSK